MLEPIPGGSGALHEQGGRVLVVDDNEMNRDLITQDLEDAGFVVVAASSGAEALLKAVSDAPEVILMDIAMPEMDGIEACRRLKANTETSSIPVVFLTAHRADEDTTVQALEAGGSDFLPKPYSLPILKARISTQLTVFRYLGRLRQMAMNDELTGLRSRRYVLDTLSRGIARAEDGASAYSVLMIDIDRFKSINDSLGHLKGDQALREVGELVRGALRAADTAGRFGGDEFVVLLPSTPEDGALRVAERIRTAVESNAVCGHVASVSIGAATYLADGFADDPPIEPAMVVQQLLSMADVALYEAKESGRNRVCLGGVLHKSESDWAFGNSEPE